MHESIYSDFKEAFLHRVKALAAGNPEREEVICGPMINAHSKARVQEWIQEALNLGGRMLFKSDKDEPGNLLRPAVLEDVPAQCRLYSDEVFGPVVMMESYRDLDEAIARVNSGRWGLQAGLFTQDVSTLFKAFRNLEVGALLHNDTPTWRVDQMPYGGIKDSGLGREGPVESMRDYTDSRMLALRWDTI